MLDQVATSLSVQLVNKTGTNSATHPNIDLLEQSCCMSVAQM